jgi:enoyl-CoA hydratase/carnithine racemase
LVELLGYSRAASLCLTGRRISAAEADRIGLVSEVVPVAELDAAADRFVNQILQLQRDAVVEVKALLLAAADNSQAGQERAEREAQYRRLRALAGLDAES